MLPVFARLLAALVFGLAFSAPASAQAAKDPARETFKPVSVNGKAIPKSRFDFVVRQRAAQGAPDNEAARNTIRENLITQEVVAQEAERKGMGKSAEVQNQLAFARQQVLIQAYMQDYFKSHPIKDEELLAEYNKVKAARGDKEYKVRHILVDKDAEAKEIIAQLKKGSKFDDLAKQSKDPGSKDRGGDLDWNTPATFVKPFSEAMVKLEKGKHTESPVQSQFGWHVIQVDDVRPLQFPAFADVKSQLLSVVQEREVQKIVLGLRAKAKIQ